MMMRMLQCLTTLRTVIAVAAGTLCLTASAYGQGLVDSFENPTGIINVTEQGNNGSSTSTILVHSPAYPQLSTIGATNGTNSMLLQLLGGGTAFAGDSLFDYAVQDTVTQANNAVGYASFAAAAANPANYDLKYDITLPANAWAGTDFADGSTHWSFPAVGLSYDGGFAQVQSGTNLYGATGKVTVTTPLTSLVQTGVPLPNNSSFYGVLFGFSQRFQSPTPTTGVNYYVDNVRIANKPVTTPVTLFSWETPDNAATPNVNEALENWSGNGLTGPSATSLNDRYAHTDSVTTYSVLKPPAGGAGNAFPTAGTHSLKIDTTSQDPAYVAPGNTTGLTQSYGFRWGTNMVLDANTAPAGSPPVYDPAIKAKITDIAHKINTADSIQFDVVFSDPIADANPDGRGVFQGGSTASLPGFLSVAMHVSDDRGTFYQYDAPALNGAALQAMILEQNPDGVAPDEPITLTFPISAFTNRGGRAGAGDLTSDKKVDAADLAFWKANSKFTGVTNVAADTVGNDGYADGAEFLAIQRGLGTDVSAPGLTVSETSNFLRIGLALNFNNGPVIAHIDNFRVLITTSGGTSAPEPTSAALAAAFALAALGLRRRRI